MAKSSEKLQAIAFRRAGESVKDIAKKLGVSRGSVSMWTRDIILTDTQRNLLRERQVTAGHKGRIMGVEANKAKKAARIELAQTEAVDRVPVLSKESLFYTGLGLYWGEGAKTTNSSLAISNTDPRIIALMIRWFIECFDVDRSYFMPRVFISDIHRDREEIITAFWVNTLGIPRAQFRRMVFLDKGKKIYENHNIYYGVLALRIAKGGDLRYKILAQIERIAELNNPKPV